MTKWPNLMKKIKQEIFYNQILVPGRNLFFGSKTKIWPVHLVHPGIVQDINCYVSDFQWGLLYPPVSIPVQKIPTITIDMVQN